MKAVFTARRLNAGHYDDFRKAWEPEQWPAGFKGAYLMRDTADPDQITVIGMFDVSDDEAARMQTDLEQSERDRHERMAPHIAETLVSGLFDLIVHETGGPTGNQTAVLLTERMLKPGSFDDYAEAGRRVNEQTGGMPAGLEFMMLQDTANAEHVIQLGIVRVADMQAFRDSVGSGRQEMLDAIGPYVASVGLDTTYEMIEEVAPVHA
jgi:heme-degrading monooxygenase HmoA